MTVQWNVKKNHNCQVNKHRQHKDGKLSTNLATNNPWEALFVAFIGLNTLKGKDRIQIDYMCATMIDQASSWFEL